MTDNQTNIPYSLPQIGRVKLHGFDLYTEQPDVDVKISKSIFCLIGANGLGKTTFLNTLVYALTGAIPDPDRKFHSAQKYYREASRSEKTSDYFEGRISESNRPNSGVTLELEWPENKVVVTRGFFDGANISALTVTNKDNHTTTYDAVSGESEEKFEGIYQDIVKQLTGVDDYSQFVFIVHFILTFDESRHLLMWHDAALTNALYLAFSSNPDDPPKADKLRADMNRMDSKGRNAKYGARQIADRIKVIAEAADINTISESENSNNETLLQKHADLLDGFKSVELRQDEKRIALQDTELKWSDSSAKLTEVQLEYQSLFSKFFQGGSAAHHHPLVKATISENRCAVCATEGVAEDIAKALNAGSCPLCNSSLDNASKDNEGSTRLKALDKQISQIREDISSHLIKRERLDAEYRAAIEATKAAEGLLVQFENASDVSFEGRGDPSIGSSVTQAISQLQNEHDLFVKESKEFYAKRDELRKALRPLEAKLRKEYDEAATTFVPRFRELAESFIGKEIDIGLKHHNTSKTKSGFGLTLHMDGEPRLLANTVSESQGFFVDIALRMALAEYMAEGPATLFVDTPEGSLDIAYEARAGAMFANFADAENCILMTANLRSSELVRRLAQRLSHSGMQIERMTEWTELSDVQKEEEVLFENAYNDITSALGLA